MHYCGKVLNLARLASFGAAFVKFHPNIPPHNPCPLHPRRPPPLPRARFAPLAQVLADVSQVTGRMHYRGKVMNRAARIAAKANSSTVWCSSSSWDLAERVNLDLLASMGIHAEPLGLFHLKVRLGRAGFALLQGASGSHLCGT
eukprot:163080-Chlamydomonas_euryale.AAC.2